MTTLAGGDAEEGGDVLAGPLRVGGALGDGPRVGAVGAEAEADAAAGVPTIELAVSSMSRGLGSVRCMQIARFILAESRAQLDSPTMAIGGLTSIACSTLRGMSGD